MSSEAEQVEIDLERLQAVREAAQALAAGHDLLVETSAETDKLDAALAKAQGAMHNPGYDSENAHFRNRYASLAACLDVIRPACSAAGIAFSQFPVNKRPGVVGIVTMLRHAGQWYRSTLWMPTAKWDAHGVGGAITYGKRYALCGIFGVAGDEDDDGNLAAGKPQAQAGKPTPDEMYRRGYVKGQAADKPPKLSGKAAPAPLVQAINSPADMPQDEIPY